MGSIDNSVICCLTRERTSQEFAQKTVDYINRVHRKTPLADIEEIFSAGSFSGGEFSPRFRQDYADLKGSDVYLMGVPTIPLGLHHKVTPGELMNRTITAAQTAYDCGADNVHVVFPNLMFARADKKQDDFPLDSEAYGQNAGRGRTLLAQIKALWANDVRSIITVDHHSPLLNDFATQVYGRDDAVSSLDTNPLTAHYLVNESPVSERIARNGGGDFVLIAADKGIKPKINNLLDILKGTYGLDNVSALYLDKFRKHPNNPDELLIKPNDDEPHSPNFTTLEGKTILILDDMIDTAGTMTKASHHIFHKGIECNGNGYETPAGAVGIFTHPVLAGNSYEEPMKKLLSAGLDDLAMYNTHPFIEEKMLYPLKKTATIIRLAKPMGEAIALHARGHDINSMFYTDGAIDTSKVEGLYNQRRSSSHLSNHH